MNHQKHYNFAKYLVNLLENRFKILGFKFGIDPIIGLIPGLGDLIPFLLSFYFIYIGYMAGMSKDSLLKMLLFSFIDFFIGTVPIVGDILDFFYHGHLKNFEVLQKYYKDKFNISL